MNTSEVQGLEQQLEEAKQLIERRKMALDLLKNRNFRKLIMEDFLVKEAANLVGQSGDPALTPEQRSDALAMAQAAGHLKRFLSAAVQMGHMVERDIPQLEQALSEARLEEEAGEQAGDGDDAGGLSGQED